MEILAVIKAIDFVQNKYATESNIKIISDSQYVIGLIGRQSKFKISGYKTKSGNDIRNVDLVKKLLDLFDNTPVKFIKVKAHQKPNNIINYNIEVDKLSRKLVREQLV